MAALANRARVHMGQPPKGAAAPTLPSPNTRADEATSTSHLLRIFCQNQTRHPSPSQERGRSRTVADQNMSA
jgi:hypothetical protein